MQATTLNEVYDVNILLGRNDSSSLFAIVSLLSDTVLLIAKKLRIIEYLPYCYHRSDSKEGSLVKLMYVQKTRKIEGPSN